MSDTTNRTSIKPVMLPQGLRYRHLIHAPGTPIDTSHVSVPELEAFIQAHLLMLRSIDRANAPRIALVQSVPGTGKSQTCLYAALMLGTAVARVPPSIFGSKHEGGAVENFTELMHTCERYSAETKQYIAVQIEDIDAGILSISENTGHTVNTKEAIGHIQTVADNKALHVNHDGTAIPIIATANAATEVRASLFRPGRADTYTHVVPTDVKRAIVDEVFRPVSPEEQRILDRLFKAYATEQPAFWKAVHHDYKKHRIGAVIKKHGADMTAVNAELARRVPLDSDLLHELARNRRAARPVDYLFNRKR